MYPKCGLLILFEPSIRQPHPLYYDISFGNSQGWYCTVVVNFLLHDLLFLPIFQIANTLAIQTMFTPRTFNPFRSYRGHTIINAAPLLITQNKWDISNFLDINYIMSSLKSTLLAKSTKIRFAYFCLVDNSLDVPSIIYEQHLSRVLLGEKIINTLSGSSFVDKIAVCLCFRPTNNQHRMVICIFC